MGTADCIRVIDLSANFGGLGSEEAPMGERTHVNALAVADAT
jgi:hypothetical protein